MITLITGTPGAGKTLLAVSMLLEEKGERPLFISGIPELKIDHQPTPPLEEWTRDVPTPEDEKITRPIFNFPANSIIVVDEAQNVYRPRPVGSKVPPFVAAFETHRHTGVDFWLITQHPGLLDANVRKLVGRHIHIRNTALGRYLYEWPECGEPESKSSREISASRRYTLPKKVFGLYKSASLHIKQKRSIPRVVYVLVAAISIGGFLAWRTYTRIGDVAGGNPFGEKGKGSLGAPGQVPGGGQGPAQQRPMTQAEYVASYAPRVDGFAHTSPRYDGLTQPTHVPIPAACIATAKDCRCWSQQATRLIVSVDMCRQIVQNGYFIDFDPDKQQKGMDGQQMEPRTVRTADTVPIGPAGPSIAVIPDDGHWEGPRRAGAGSASGMVTAGPVVEQAQGIGRGRTIQSQ